jgi:Uma2 family endonuclease
VAAPSKTILYTRAMPREAPVRQATSFDEFLEFEIHSQERHEFVDGNLFVMPGGTDRHNGIALNLVMKLRPVALKQGCQLYVNDVLIRTQDETGYYPDVFITCDSSEDTPRVKRRPNIIVEVLSDSTEKFDRTEKLCNYRTIPSLELYVLLEQDSILAEVYAKQPDNSWRHDVLREGSSIAFSSLELMVPLADLYENLPEVE